MTAWTRDLRATATDFTEARTPPGQMFWDETLYRRELSQLFGREWLCVAHQSRLASPGDFVVVDVGPESIIVVRDDAQQINAFANVCRHRGTRLCQDPAGRTRGFTCPYHAWRYDLEGNLVAAPSMDSVAGFQRSDYPLARVRIDTFCGFVFLNLSEDAPTLAETYADFPDFSHLNLGDLRCVATHDYDVAANWKLICENYHECYHCQLAHPQLHRVSDHNGIVQGDFCGERFVGGPMAIKPGFNTLTNSGVTTRQPLPGCRDEDLARVHYFNLLPNFLLSIAPDYVLTHYLWPAGVDRVHIQSEWLFASAETQSADFDPGDAVQFWDETNRQDWVLCETAMRGLRSANHRPGPYAPAESCTHRFDQWYVQTMFPEFD